MNPLWAGPVRFPPLGDISNLEDAQKGWRRALADDLYGPVPAPPGTLSVERHALSGEAAERVVLHMTADGRELKADAALWLPDGGVGPAPLIVGLDFLGPAGVLAGDAFPLDPEARVYFRDASGSERDRMADDLRGASAYRWPVDEILGRGWGLLLACYGSWAPDEPRAFRTTGAGRLPGFRASGAISAWAWAFSRLIDAAWAIPGVDAGRIAVAGHSRLGKAALWAAANDARIGVTFANASGAAGAAPARHPVGETLAELSHAFPHWLRPDANVSLAVDQHQLIAALAPRAVYLASARDDVWADPLGSYEALRVASAAWGDDPARWPGIHAVAKAGPGLRRGRLGHHLRDGGHDLLPEDWLGFLAFLDAEWREAEGDAG